MERLEPWQLKELKWWLVNLNDKKRKGMKTMAKVKKT
jgi:hypothetical protein